MKNAKKIIAMLLALVMVLALCACGSKTEAPAAAVETKVLKCAFNQTIENPEAKTLQWIGEKLYEATEGRYTIEVYPDAQLGDQAQTLEQVVM
ncbi:MAG: TRAP transporter substrate-binding protein, partial [Candidatus Limivicinus sp.]